MFDNIIASKYHSTRKFSYHKDTNTFVAEASDLGPFCYYGYVYNDAADEGFVLVSHKTGDSVVVALDSVDMNGDDVAGYRYKVVAEQARSAGKWQRSNKNFTVLVIND